MTALRQLASELHTSDRTLRRAVNDGAVHASRPTPRKLELPLSERQYLRSNWKLLSSLRSVLRTESNVRFAMLFGSRARGSSTPASDVDILVDLRKPDLGRLVDLAAKLTDTTGLQVDLVLLDEARSDPELLADWVEEGRVLVDRASVWPALRKQQPALRSKGSRAEAERTRAALQGIDRMLGR
jgi:predicted nucleotidyltransferase